MRRIALVLAFAVLTLPAAIRAGAKLPNPEMDDPLAPAKGRATLTLGGGCFWGVEEVYQHTRGVASATTGYTLGTASTARYELVASGTTAHVEVVQVDYDPSRISMGTILKIFFSVVHDPTQVGGQGPDVGPEYRSVILFTSDRQKQVAEAYIAQLTAARVFRAPITTQVLPLGRFHRAELEHQDFVEKNPLDRYVQEWERPKINEFRSEFPELFIR